MKRAGVLLGWVVNSPLWFTQHPQPKPLGGWGTRREWDLQHNVGCKNFEDSEIRLPGKKRSIIVNPLTPTRVSRYFGKLSTEQLGAQRILLKFFDAKSSKIVH